MGMQKLLYFLSQVGEACVAGNAWVYAWKWLSFVSVSTTSCVDKNTEWAADQTFILAPAFTNTFIPFSMNIFCFSLSLQYFQQFYQSIFLSLTLFHLPSASLLFLTFFLSLVCSISPFSFVFLSVSISSFIKCLGYEPKNFSEIILE